ncbi:MAG: glutamine synthetase family protein [Bacteroidales bacterium]|nr:glutamine synthetase family protein [Bacteroidales bacterium]
MKRNLEMNPNLLVQYLEKDPKDFTCNDLIRFIEFNGIEMVNFRYVGGDGRLKTLNFVINNRNHLEEILTSGERVDGSSLFSHIEAGSSDLYVIPKYRTAFVNPFEEIPTLDILCAYYDKEGNPLASSPQHILKKAADVLIEKTGYSFECMGELEYYVISEREAMFEADNQRGYHESYPFNKFEQFRTDALHAIAACGGQIKYAHSEVGNFTLNDKVYEQNEIEFLPVAVEDAADQLVIAKWILRSMAFNYGVDLTFAPKISVGKAGSGMHVHTRLMKEGRSVMLNNGILSDIARKSIAGFLTLAPSLTAFGNTNPTSYFRLVPHQEAPTNICWGDRNRSVLVRVPLGWAKNSNMAADANPQDKNIQEGKTDKQTVEFRCPDGSADIYLLLAGLTVAARYGIELENALSIAQENYVDVNIFDEEHKERVKNLAQLPTSCHESATMLEKQAEIYKQFDVFPDALIKGVVKQLKSFDDSHLREEIANNKEKLMDLVTQYYHCG